MQAASDREWKELVDAIWDEIKHLPNADKCRNEWATITGRLGDLARLVEIMTSPEVDVGRSMSFPEFNDWAIERDLVTSHIREDAVADELVKHNDTVQRRTMPGKGAYLAVRPPATFHSTPTRIRSHPPPAPGQHSREIEAMLRKVKTKKGGKDGHSA